MSYTTADQTEKFIIEGREYLLLELLQRGPLATAYQVDNGGERFVLKVFTPEYASKFHQLRRMWEDSNLGFQSAVAGFERLGVWEGSPYLLRRWVAGRNFSEFAHEFKFSAATPERTLNLGQLLCESIAKLHAVGLIHGHLWNGNLILGDHGPVITDSFIGAPTSRELADSTAPLFEYRHLFAPEQKELSSNLDARTDIWHIGALLCRLLTGKPNLAINDLVLRELYSAKIPLNVIRVIWHSIHEVPALRFQTMSDFSTALAESFLPDHKRTIVLRSIPKLTGAQDDWTPQLRKPFLAVASIAAIIGAGVLWKGSQEEKRIPVVAVGPTPITSFTPPAVPSPGPIQTPQSPILQEWNFRQGGLMNKDFRPNNRNDASLWSRADGQGLQARPRDNFTMVQLSKSLVPKGDFRVWMSVIPLDMRAVTGRGITLDLQWSHDGKYKANLVWGWFPSTGQSVITEVYWKPDGSFSHEIRRLDQRGTAGSPNKEYHLEARYVGNQVHLFINGISQGIAKQGLGAPASRANVRLLTGTSVRFLHIRGDRL